MIMTCKNSTAYEMVSAFDENAMFFTRTDFDRAVESMNDGQVYIPTLQTLLRNDYIFVIGAERTDYLDEDGYPAQGWRYFYRWNI